MWCSSLTPSNAVGLDAIALAKGLHRDASLVLVHAASTSAPTKRPDWLPRFQAAQILHIRSENQTDLEKVLRLITHRAMCVVFSGGGARALAHVGVLLAFEEKGLTIDAVGGTSMGALVAGLVAQGRNANQILEGMRRHLVERNPILHVSCHLAGPGPEACRKHQRSVRRCMY